MYQVVINVTIIQTTQLPGATRDKTLFFDFVHEITCKDSWRDLTNTGTIILPKNLYYRDENNDLTSISGVGGNVGGFSSANPLLMKGDKVLIDWGYYYQNNKKVAPFLETTKSPANVDQSQATTHLFEGWISEVTSKKPIEFKIEDNMYQLKQIACPTHTLHSPRTLADLMITIFKDINAPYTVNKMAATTIGTFMTGNETVAEMLERLRKLYHMESYFRGNELRIGLNMYIDSEAKTFTFTFQQNIISDSLDYKRKDDQVMSIEAHNTIEEDTGKTTKDGKNKTKKNRLACLVTFAYGSETPTVYVKQPNKDYPPNIGGERISFPYFSAKTINDLVKAATKDIHKYYYTGFKGKFTTFGIPYVKMGDNINIIDPVLPERNGCYKVRSVEYKGGVEGLRQEIELDYFLHPITVTTTPAATTETTTATETTETPTTQLFNYSITPLIYNLIT
jgi:hypothetical protein